MAINRFSRPTQLASYKPMSFQELAFAPVQMRQREDRMADAQSTILSQLNNMEFYDGFGDEANQMRQSIVAEVDQLTNDIQKNGATTEAVNRLQNLRNKYNTLVSESGSLGIASGIKKTIDEQKAAYLQFAIQNQGQSPADAERNFQVELEKFKQGLPSKLGELKNGAPNFSPSLAPKSVDYKAKIKGLVDLIGTVEDQIGKVDFRPVEDAQGNIIGYRAFNHKNQVIENNDKIDSIIEIMEGEVLNPNSELGQDMRYKNLTPEYMLDMVKKTANLPRSSRTSDVTSYAGFEQVPGTSTGRSSQRTTSDANGKDQVNLVKVDGTGKSTLKGTSTIQDIDKQLEAIERGEIDIKDPKERNRVINGLYHARLDRMAELNEYADPNSKTYGEFKSSMDKLIDGNANLNARGIHTYDDYLKAQKDPSVLKPTETAHSTYDMDNRSSNSPQQELSLVQMEVNKLKNTAFATRTASGDMKINNEIYTFGAGDADEKLTETFHKAINPTSLQGLAAIKAIEVAGGPMGERSYEVANEDDIAQLREVLNTGMNEKEGARFTFGGFSTGSEYSSPKLMYTMYNPDGNRVDFAIKLQDNEFTDEILSHLETNLTDEDRSKVAAIRDNVKFGGVPVTKSSLPSNSFNDDVNYALKDYSSQVNSAIVAAVPNKSNPQGINKALWNSLFIKPNDEDHDYAMVINDDGSYSTVKKNQKTNEVEYFTIGDHVNKQLMSALAVKYGAGEDVDENYYKEDPNGIKEYNKAINNFFTGIIGAAKDISSRSNIANNSLIYNDEDDTFARTIQEAYDIIYDNKINSELKNVKLAQLYNNIKGKKLQTKRKKLAF